MDDLHAEIFGRPNVTGARVIGLWECFKSVIPALGEIDDQQFAHYTLTKYFLAFIVASIVKSDPKGREVFEQLDKVLANGKIDEFVQIFGELAVAAANDLNAEAVAEEEKDEGFDYKAQLKSPNWCRTVAKRVLAQFKKDVARKKAKPISKLVEGLLD